jgi:isopentenyl-diphosphate delta-isomerase
VFIGRFDGQPRPNPEEVEEWKWMGLEELRKDMAKHPEKYTYWLKAVIDRFISYTKA